MTTHSPIVVPGLPADTGIALPSSHPGFLTPGNAPRSEYDSVMPGNPRLTPGNYQGVYFPDGVDCRDGDGIWLIDCVVSGTLRTPDSGDPYGLIVCFSFINGGSNPYAVGSTNNGRGYALFNSTVIGGKDNFKMAGNVRVENTFAGFQNKEPGDHNDASQDSGGAGNVLVIHSTLLAPYQGSTNAFRAADAVGKIDDVWVRDCVLGGGSYTVHFDDKAFPGVPTNSGIEDCLLLGRSTTAFLVDPTRDEQTLGFYLALEGDAVQINTTVIPEAQYLVAL